MSNMASLFSLLFFFFLIPVVYTEVCHISTCGDESLPVRFPFQLETYQPQHCGYPGLDLTCEGNKTVLKLPYSGKFYVRQISYISQRILLYDPNNCLPKRLLSLNMSGSPFDSIFHQNYTFLSCPLSFTKSRFTPIDCLSNSTTSVLATPSISLANRMTDSDSCKIIKTVSIPIPGPVQYESDTVTNLDDDLRLMWYVPNCNNCETQGGFCGFTSNNSEEIGCFVDPKSGGSKDGLRIFRIICLAIAVPAITCACGIACFAGCLDRRNSSATRQRRATAISAAPETTVGLDDTTIESYQKVVLGESRRLPGLNDTTCPICLSEYNSKETLRCIPECKHCFHAECIDEWLRLNGSCPVCRNSPSPARLRISSDAV